MTIVYRIQDHSGRGPWRPGMSRFWMDGPSDRDFALPLSLPRGSMRPADASCGYACRSIEDLRWWVRPAEWERLVLLGYRAVEIAAARIVAEGERQLIFVHQRKLADIGKPFNLYPSEAPIAQ